VLETFIAARKAAARRSITGTTPRGVVRRPAWCARIKSGGALKRVGLLERRHRQRVGTEK
jgi:hypothetical protein